MKLYIYISSGESDKSMTERDNSLQKWCDVFPSTAGDLTGDLSASGKKTTNECLKLTDHTLLLLLENKRSTGYEMQGTAGAVFQQCIY